MKTAFTMVISSADLDIGLSTLAELRRLFPYDDIYVLDDNVSPDEYVRIRDWSMGSKGNYLYRNEEKYGYPGIGRSVFKLLKEVVDAGRTYEFVTKLDPDAMIISSQFNKYIMGRFEKYGPGAVGPYKIAANGSRRSNLPMVKSILRDLFPVGLRKGKPALGFPFYVPYLFKAMANGYIPGEHILGGVFSIHGSTLVKLGDHGFLSAIPDDYTGSLRFDDQLISIGVRAVGDSLVEINEVGNTRVWSQYKAPLPLSVDDVIGKNLLALHPLKNDKHSADLRDSLLSRMSLLDARNTDCSM